MSEDWHDLLRGSYLFDEAPETLFRQALSTGRHRDIASGEFLIRQGEMSDHIYVVLDGRFEVILADPSDRTRPLRLALCKTGDVIGEYSLLDEQAATANVRACEAARVFELSHDALRKFMTQDCSTASIVLRKMLVNLITRLRRETAEVLLFRA